MPRVAPQPFAQAVAATVFAVLALGAMLRVGATYDASETLPRYGAVSGEADSLALVRAANDALQGRASVELPMVTTYFRRQGQTAMLTLRPVPAPGIVWRDVGGTVRILSDGRRVVIARE
jgi:hypothetical protein